VASGPLSGDHEQDEAHDRGRNDRESDHGRPCARTLLVAGTASHVGKSTVAAGLCRLLADRGVSVAPFKAQNMSNNARAVPRTPAARDAAVEGPTGEGSAGGNPAIGDAPDDAFGEVGVSQYVQARAARVRPTTDHNPVLLKPRGDGESQLVIDGAAVGHYRAGDYYEGSWERARAAAAAAHERLAAAHEVVIAEGAGSIAEINLHHRDLANAETARFADADVLLLADIERGGVFASLVGSLELMPADCRERVVGVVITKFRGDRSLLDPGLHEFEERTSVPVLGVLPHDDPGLPAEDSVSLPPTGERAVHGTGDGVPDARTVTIAVPRLPRISNFTDLDPLAREPGVRVAYVPLDDDLAETDAVVLPGTKNTVDDALALAAAGFDGVMREFEGPVVGLCGGYQLLGERITNAASEGTGDRDTVACLGLLPVETRFSAEKRVERVTRELRGVGPLAGGAGPVSGYEIHAGETAILDDAARPFEDEGAATDRVLGTYLHGLFENRSAREAFLDNVFRAAGRDRPAGGGEGDGSPHDRAAALVDEYVDVATLGFA
jgi:adenosylcobyric acid synthase